jgi:hypothetical protein
LSQQQKKSQNSTKKTNRKFYNLADEDENKTENQFQKFQKHEKKISFEACIFRKHNESEINETKEKQQKFFAYSLKK